VLKNWGMVHYLNFSIFKNEDNEFYKVEGFMDGKFEKISNNYDHLNTNVETRHLTAFSHYTYEKSNHDYMVTDL
jgi:hypothetical protein